MSGQDPEAAGDRHLPNMNWIDYAGLALPECLPCCNQHAIAVCDCVNPAMNFGTVPPSVWGDYDLALAETVRSYDCYALWTERLNPLPDSLTFSIIDSSQVCWNCENSNDDRIIVSTNVTVAANSTLTVDWNITGATPAYIYVTLWECDGETVVEQQSQETPSATGNFTFSVAQAGSYMVIVQYDYGTSETGIIEICISSDSALVPNPIVFPYLDDDLVTIRHLEACPKMLLPILTEQNGNWFEDETAAQDWITAWTKSCIVANAEDWAYAWSASFASEELTVSGGPASPEAGDFQTFWFSVNAEAGETFTLTFTAGANTVGTFSIFANYGEEPGEHIEDVGPGTSPITSSALPYTGRYLVAVSLYNPDPGDPTFEYASFVFSSSGTLSINQIQALYDVALSCPARLNCTE